jgi:hypothetical protein
VPPISPPSGGRLEFPSDAWGAEGDGPTVLAPEEPAAALELLAEPRTVSGLTPLPVPRDPRAEAVRMFERARELQNLDDHSGARELLLKAQALWPELTGLSDALARSETKLQTIYESKIGKLSAVPRVRLKEDEVIWLNLDHRAGFMLAQIDGTLSFEDLFSVSGMSRLDTARSSPSCWISGSSSAEPARLTVRLRPGLRVGNPPVRWSPAHERREAPAHRQPPVLVHRVGADDEQLVAPPHRARLEGAGGEAHVPRPEHLAKLELLLAVEHAEHVHLHRWIEQRRLRRGNGEQHRERREGDQRAPGTAPPLARRGAPVQVLGSPVERYEGTPPEMATAYSRIFSAPIT